MSRALQSLQSTLVPDGACQQVCPVPAHQSSAPMTLDRLKPQRVLGRSSHQTRVLLATDTATGQQVAVKIMYRTELSPLQQHAVLRGCAVHAKCCEAAVPHVLPFFCALQDASRIFIISAAAEKGDLAAFQATCGRTLTPTQAVKFVLKPLVTALQCMHTRQLIHRDIKPENMLLAADNTVQLCDFDLSIDANMESPTSRVGTPDYIAPELLGTHLKRGGDPYTVAVDVWAVGVLAFELLSGKAPFTASTVKAIHSNVVNKKIAIPQDWPEICQDFVARCLNRDPKQRPNADALLEHQFMKLA